MTAELFAGPDGRPRCSWCAGAPELLAYHDAEWGLPLAEDRRLFEKVCLEGFQAGLSWLTILRKREGFRRAFAGFDLAKVARFGARDVKRLLADEGIIRHRGKIESAIGNARRALDLAAECGSLAAFFGRFAGALDGKALSKELKRRGWMFVGPTTMYALMQAVGIVNDHADGCAFRQLVEQARRAAGLTA